MMRALVLGAWLAAGLDARLLAQVLEVSGGSSTLYQAEGGGVVVRTPNSESGVSAGMVAGRFVAGAHAAYRTACGGVYTVGTEELRMNLPTDVFGGDHRLLGLGAGLKTQWSGTDVEGFAGASSTRSDTPLFEGAAADQAEAAVVLRRRISEAVQATLLGSVGAETTLLGGVSWRPLPWLTLAGSAGFAGGSRYSALSVGVVRPRLDLKAEYAGFAAGLERPGNDVVPEPEPVGANVEFTWRSSVRPHVSVSGGRQSSVMPGAWAVSTVDELSASGSAARGGLTGTVLRSSYLGQRDVALALSGTGMVTDRLRLGANYFGSRLLGVAGATMGGALQVSAEETLSPRLSVTETLNRSNGQSSVSFGGSLLTNAVTISADWETFYVPTRPQNPFQQTLVLNVQLNFFGRIALHAGTFVSPAGKMLYTTDARAVESRVPVAKVAGRANFGECVLAGRVVDAKGNAIAGAAVQVEKTLLFSDSNGEFFLREKRPRVHRFALVMEEFLDERRYRVLFMPQTLESVRGELRPGLIVLEPAP